MEPPSIAPDGQLTDLDAHGVRHVVALLPPDEEASADWLLAQIQQNQALFDQIERLCQQWIEEMNALDFAAGDAMG